MIDKPLYAPCQKDIEWANGMLDALRDGGVLTFPASQLTYHVDHEHKALTLQNLDQTVLSFDSFVVLYGKLHSSSSPCWLVYGAASSNDRRTRAIGLKTERLPRRSC